MDIVPLMFFSAILCLVYIGAILGLMAWMAHKASLTAPRAISHIPDQANLWETIQEFAQKHRYRIIHQQHNNMVLRKGRGWLTSLTELHLKTNEDGSVHLEVLEAVNFLFKKIYFPINAPTFLGKPVRQHKIKHINLLLERLQATPIAFGSGTQKKIRLKK